jgi:hypothetical protein
LVYFQQTQGVISQKIEFIITTAVRNNCFIAAITWLNNSEDFRFTKTCVMKMIIVLTRLKLAAVPDVFVKLTWD